MNKHVKNYLSKIASAGGKAGAGQSKARTREQAQKAARARWAKVKKGKV